MKHICLNEDKLPSRLFVTFSSMISNRIDSISVYNCNNTESLSQWYDYIDGIKRYVSNPTIALDYMGRYPQFPNGAKFIKDFDYNIGYTIKTNNSSEKAYVYVFMINLKPREFGLEVPPNLKENYQRKKRISLTESDLHRIIKDTIYEVLNDMKNPVVREPNG